jgi:hypothetical protein
MLIAAYQAICKPWQTKAISLIAIQMALAVQIGSTGGE